MQQSTWQGPKIAHCCSAAALLRRARPNLGRRVSGQSAGLGPPTSDLKAHPRFGPPRVKLSKWPSRRAATAALLPHFKKSATRARRDSRLQLL
eukprot:15472960-Alexandrium_andersonii.AAC.1